jgi:hypothetical protein
MIHPFTLMAALTNMKRKNILNIPFPIIAEIRRFFVAFTNSSSSRCARITRLLFVLGINLRANIGV